MPGPAIVPWGTGIETGCGDGPQLYDAKRDVTQQHNLADRHPEVVRRMNALLQSLGL